jgi:hypothetical protein
MPDTYVPTITAIKTAIFKLRAPSARKRRILLDALRRNHLATRALLAAFVDEIDRIAAVPSQAGRLSVMQRIASSVLATWDLCGSAAASARVDAMALIESYLASIGDGRETASLPTVPGLESTAPGYAEALRALAESVPDLDHETSLRDELTRLAHEPRLRPLGLYGYRYFYRLLRHPESDRLYAWVNIMPRISRHAPTQVEANQAARDVAGDMIDIATGEVIRCKRPTWVLFPLSFSFSYHEQEFILSAEPCGGRLVYQPEADRFELHAGFRYTVPAIDTGQRFCGVDRGLYNLVAWTVIDGAGTVLEEGAVSGLRLRYVQRAIERRKTTEQRRGRQPTGRQRRSQAEEAVHTAINAVIAAARRHSARVVLEDLTIQRLSTDVRIGPPGDMRKGSPVQFSVIAAYNPWWSISSVG